jgi:hypothetical protein
MRHRKRLRWAREEDVNGLVAYRAKRKDETLTILPSPGGGGPYTVIYRSHKCKRKAVVATLVEARETGESLRASARKPNPLAPSRSTRSLLIGAGVGVVLTTLISWWYSKCAASVYVQLQPSSTSTSYSGGTLFVELPVGATAWTSVNGNTASGNAPLQLSDTPAGSYTFGYLDSSGAQQTATLTVTAVATAGAAA